MATTVVQVAVLGAGGDGPQRDPAATLSLEVGKKSSTVIGRSHLAYTVSEEVSVRRRVGVYTAITSHLFALSLTG